MKKIICIMLSLLCCGINAAAVDLPAEIVHTNICLGTDYIAYVTQDGSLCRNFYDRFQSSKEPMKEPIETNKYFDNVKTIEKQMYTNKGYYISNNDELYHYTINIDTGEVETLTKIPLDMPCVKAQEWMDEFVVALTSDGNVWTWGANDRGQLGNGTAESTDIPTKLASLSDIVDIDVGEDHAFALDSEGNVYQWGDDRGGIRTPTIIGVDGNVLEQGYDEAGTVEWSPIIVDGIQNCINVESNCDHVWFLLSDGNVEGIYIEPDAAKNKLQVQAITDISATYGLNELLLDSEGKVYQNGISFDMLCEWSKPNCWDFKKVENFRNVKYILAATGYMNGGYIDNENNVWLGTADKRGIVNCGEPYIFIGADSEDPIKTESVRFVKRYEMAGRIAELCESMKDIKIQSKGSIQYDDISESANKSRIEQCCSWGLMDGTSNTSFSPNKVLRREQTAAILYRLIQNAGLKPQRQKSTRMFDDNADISPWAKEAVYATRDLFKLRGNKYRPSEYVTSDELDEIIENFKAVYAREGE